MACMCGDYCCPSCGPAQGNWRCPICRAWVSDGCEHVEIRLKPEFEAEAERILAAEVAAEQDVPEVPYINDPELYDRITKG